jgi:hypothetical protein
MTAISRVLRPGTLGIVGVLSLSFVIMGCGESRPVGGDAGTKMDGRAGTGGSAGVSGSGGTSGATGTGGRAGSGGGAGGTGGLRLDGGLPDINLDGISFDLSGIDINVPMCPSNVKTGDACTASDRGCLSGGTVCFCVAMKWNCFSGGADR